jgi:superfamily II DNA/RNA helicase
MTAGNRVDIIKRFAPYYNGKSSQKLQEKGWNEIRILISTDVLSEGLNLQDATMMINYDIHWNPVRLMQRIGRVDRRLNPQIELKMIADHPELKSLRRKVNFWNFLPPDELNQILSLYKTVTRKTLLISKTLGIEGKKLLRPEDDYDALREFNHEYEGNKTAIEDIHLEYQALLKQDPSLEAKLKRLPEAVFSGKEKIDKGIEGVFFCYALPALDKEKNEFTEEAGIVRWYLYDLDRKVIIEEPKEIIENIRSKPETPRKCSFEESNLIEIKAILEKHIKNSYLKQVNAPIGIKPKLKCWLELDGDS